MSGGGSQKSETSSTEKSTHKQDKNYEQLLSGADNFLNSGGFDKNYGGSEDFNPVAGLNSTQQSGISGMANTGANLSDVYNGVGIQSLQNYLGAYDPSKTGLTSAINAANEQMLWNFNTDQAARLRSEAMNAGQYGGTRQGIAEGIARDRLNQTMANNAANMAYQDQQSYANNQLNALNSLTNITKGLSSGSGLQYDAGSLEQSQEQRELLGQLDKWAYENQVDNNTLLAYKQLISGDMGGVRKTNSTTTESGGGSGLGSALGAIGGAALGSMTGGIGTALGQSLGSQMGAGILGG